jgi:hypothetical protein
VNSQRIFRSRTFALRRARTEQSNRGIKNWAYIPDFNEKCRNVEYYLTFLRRLKEKLPMAFKRIEYVE